MSTFTAESATSSSFSSGSKISSTWTAADESFSNAVAYTFQDSTGYDFQDGTEYNFFEGNELTWTVATKN